MKRIAETVTTNNNSSAFSVGVGPTQQNDLILAVASISNSSTFTVAGSDTFVTAGFTLKGTGGSGPRLYFYWKLAGASEPSSFSAQTSSFAAANVAILVYRGVDLASTIDSAAAVFTAIASTTTKTHAAPQIVTSGAERLVVSAALINTNQIVPDLTKVTPLVYSSQSGRLMVAKQWQESAGASPAFNWESNQTSAQTGIMGCLAIINASGASRDIGCTSTHRRLAKFNLYGTDDTFAAPSALHSSGQLDSARTLDTVASKYTSGVPSLNGVYHTGPTINNNSITGLPKQVGFALDFSSAPLDLTDALIGLSWSVGSSQWNTTVAGTYGLVLSFSDGTNVEHYQVRAASTAYLSANQLSFISLGSTTPDWYDGAVNYGSIAYIGWTYDRASGAGTNLPSVSLDSLFAYDGIATLVGGGSDNPIDAEQIYNHLVGYVAATGDVGLLPAARFQGNSQLVTAIPVQLGDGTTPTYIDLSLKSLDTPRVTTRLDDYDCAAGLSGITLYPSASCTVRIGSMLAGAVSRQYLNFHASSAVPLSFVAAGATISGRDVTWLTGLACPAMSFDACYAVDMKNADCTGTVWRNPQDPVTSTFAAASWTGNGATLTGTETDVSTTSADYHLHLGASVTSMTLVNHTFSGTAVIDKVYSELMSGTLTLYISGSTALVNADVTFPGGSTAVADVQAPGATLSATVLANTRTVLYNRSAATELSNTFQTGTAWSYAMQPGDASPGDVLDLHCFKEGYEESRASIIYSSADATFAVEQAEDAVIQAYRTAMSVTDYTTLTQFNFYAPSVYIQSDGPGATDYLQNLFIYYNGVLTTEDGARYMRGGVTFKSLTDVVINKSGNGFEVDNVSVTYGLAFADENTIRVTTDDGSDWIAAPSQPGSIRYAYGIVPGTVSVGSSPMTTADRDAILAAIPSAGTNATATRTELTTELARISDLAKRGGVVSGTPVVIPPGDGSIVAGDVEIDVSTAEDGTVTLTRV